MIMTQLVSLQFDVGIPYGCWLLHFWYKSLWMTWEKQKMAQMFGPLPIVCRPAWSSWFWRGPGVGHCSHLEWTSRWKVCVSSFLFVTFSKEIHKYIFIHESSTVINGISVERDLERICLFTPSKSQEGLYEIPNLFVPLSWSSQQSEMWQQISVVCKSPILLKQHEWTKTSIIQTLACWIKEKHHSTTCCLKFKET